MKEIQIPRKNFARSSNRGTKKLNDSKLKNRKDPTNSTPLSGAISNSEAESNSSDCVILDGDPYKTTANEKETETCENDEVLVVGQKGEIACRDFPHPRHACAKYPFNSTSHQNYCEMCHCYVCEKLAPCPFWCVGDHCHANDKEKIWKTLRECIRTTVKDPVDSTPISDSNAESNESPVSTISNVEAHKDVSSTDYQIQSKLSCSTTEESNWIDVIVTMKFRIVLLSFIVWVILATIMVFFSSGRYDPYYYVPT